MSDLWNFKTVLDCYSLWWNAVQYPGLVGWDEYNRRQMTLNAWKQYVQQERGKQKLSHAA